MFALRYQNTKITAPRRRSSVRVRMPVRSLAPASLRSRLIRIKDMIVVSLDAVDDLQGHGQGVPSFLATHG